MPKIAKNLSEKLLCNEVIEDYKIVTIKKYECISNNISWI